MIKYIMSIVYQLTPDQIVARWQEIKHHIESALDSSKCDDYTAEDIYTYATTGRCRLYAVEDGNVIHGALAVSFQKYPKDVVAYIMAIGGRDLAVEYKQLWSILKEAGANRVQGACRPSVERLWRRVGMLPKYSIVETKL